MRLKKEETRRKKERDDEATVDPVSRGRAEWLFETHAPRPNGPTSPASLTSLASPDSRGVGCICLRRREGPTRDRRHCWGNAERQGDLRERLWRREHEDADSRDA